MKLAEELETALVSNVACLLSASINEVVSIDLKIQMTTIRNQERKEKENSEELEAFKVCLSNVNMQYLLWTRIFVHF